MRICLCLLAMGVLTAALPADNWTRFRGPNGSGLSDASTIPLKWTEKDFNWKVRLPGSGHSSPVVFGERIFLTAAESSGKRLVLCLHRDGRLLWKRELAGNSYPKHKLNSLASSTPVVDADRLIVAWGSPLETLVLALDHQGKTLWQKTDLGRFPSKHGFGISPILHDGLVILHHQPDGAGRVFALDASSGAIRWQIPRKGKNATYSTPCLYQAKGRPAEVILTNWQHGVTALDLATGKINWERSVFQVNTPQRAIASPVIAGDLVIGVAGFADGRKILAAVRPAEKGREVWRVEEAVPQMATPLVKGDRVYLVTERGFASCLRVSDGKVIWRQRVRGNYTASPVCIGDRLYCTATDGRVLVLATADTFRILAESALGEPTQATPAIAGGRIYFRTEGHLISLGGVSKKN